MTWRDTLKQRPASFNGAEFQHQSHSSAYGRRISIKEFPHRDKPYIEDLGRGARFWSITGYVIGKDYMAERDALLEAIEKKGPGVLVHPWIGTVDAVCTRCQMEESSEEGGMARFTMEFVEASASSSLINPQGFFSYLSSVLKSFFTVIEKSVLNSLILSGSEHLAGALDITVTSTIVILQQNSSVFLKDFNLDSSQVELSDSIYSIRGNSGVIPFIRAWESYFLAALPIDPKLRCLTACTFAEHLLTNLHQFQTSGTVINPRISNDRSFFILAISFALAKAAESALQIEFTNRDEIEVTRDRLVEDLTIFSEFIDYEFWDSIINLRNALVHDLNALNLNKSRRRSWQSSAPLPALVIAYRLYGTIEREAEIIANNHLDYPSLAPADRNLSVFLP